MSVETTTRTFRVTPDVWQAAMERAAENNETVSEVIRAALSDYVTAHGCTDCTCGTCGLDIVSPSFDIEDSTEPEGTATIYGFGRFSDTTNPEVQALIDRAKELLAEGAVGVSIATDLNPDDLSADPEKWEDEIEDASIRPRHTAIVDTPAFSGAYVDLAEDGTVSGPIAFEGKPTGDLRILPLNSLTWDDDLLPIPILFDLADGDHTGVTIGYIDRLERVTGTAKTDGVAPLVASVAPYPAGLFAEPEPGPMTVHPADSNGFIRYSGTLAPTGVCHKGMGGCFTYKGADLDYFHSGARIALDDGSFVRVGRIVSGGLHADAKRLDYTEALHVTDDSRRAVAMGRCFDTPHGLLFSGVLLPGTDVMRLEASAPSVELWPNHRGRLELKTALMVNTPAFPVAASVGAGVQLSEPEPVIIEHPDEPDLVVRVAQLEQVVGDLYAAHLAATLG